MALQQVARAGLPARLPSEFGAMWAWRRLQLAGEDAWASSPPASPCAVPARIHFVRSSWGTHSGVGRDADGPMVEAGERRVRRKAAPTRAAPRRDEPVEKLYIFSAN